MNKFWLVDPSLRLENLDVSRGPPFFLPIAARIPGTRACEQLMPQSNISFHAPAALASGPIVLSSMQKGRDRKNCFCKCRYGFCFYTLS